MRILKDKKGAISLLLLASLFSVLLIQSSNTQELTNSGTSVNADAKSADSGNLVDPYYLQNTSGVIDWLEGMKNTHAYSPTLFSSESNKAGDITNNNITFEDYAVYLGALYSASSGDDSLNGILTRIGELENLGIYNSTVEGYYSYMYENRTINENPEMELMGNAQLILSLLDNGGVSQPIVTELWDMINTTFWDEETNLYNRSSEDSSKSVSDQLVASIIAYQLYQETDNDALFNQANATINTLLSNSSSFDVNGFNDIDLNIKTLEINAYGIWALCEHYLANTNETIQNETLLQAENIYREMDKSTSLWDTSTALYMKTAVKNSWNVLDHSMTLKGNSLMVIALKNLFEITGNMTYFARINDILGGIKDELKDSTEGNYQISDDNDNKSLNSHAYLYKAFLNMDQLSQHITFNTVLNTTIFLKDNDTAIEMNTTLIFEFANGVNASINTTDYVIRIRDSEGDLIQEKTLIIVNGTNSHVFDINSMNLSVGIYSVSLLANVSDGFYNIENATQFEVTSGLIIDAVSIVNEESIIIGGSGQLNITLENILNETQGYTIQLIGDDINSVPVNISVANLTKNHTELLYFTVASDTDVKTSDITIEITNTSYVYATYVQEISILSPIDVNVVYDENLFINVSNAFDFTIDPIGSDSPNLNIKIEGDIEAQEMLNKPISLSGTSFSNPIVLNVEEGQEQMTFTLNITRNSDGSVYYYQEYTGSVKQLLELLKITVPTESSQGQDTYVQAIVVNNLDIVQNITILIDGEDPIIKSVSPGESTIKFAIGGGFLNPYVFGIDTFNITIIDKEENEIYNELVSIDVKVSAGSLFVGYMLPFIVPVLAVVIGKQYNLVNKRQLRNK